MTDSALPQVVLQLTETAEKLADLERLVAELGADIRQQAQRTARLQALEEAFAALAAKVSEVLPDEHGTPRVYALRPAPRWWNLSGSAREPRSAGSAASWSTYTGPGSGISRPGSAPAGNPTTSACTASISQPSCTRSSTSSRVARSPC